MQQEQYVRYESNRGKAIIHVDAEDLDFVIRENSDSGYRVGNQLVETAMICKREYGSEPTYAIDLSRLTVLTNDGLTFLIRAKQVLVGNGAEKKLPIVLDHEAIDVRNKIEQTGINQLLPIVHSLDDLLRSA